MRKLLLRFICLGLTLTLGGIGVTLRRAFRFAKPNLQLAQTAASNKDEGETVWRCDDPPDLPKGIRFLLDRTYPGWQFHVPADDDCQIVKTWGGENAYAQLIQGDFDDNGQLDYAVLIDDLQRMRKEEPNAHRPYVYLVSFLARRNRYRLQVVTFEGGGSLQLMRKGLSDFDYGAQREFTYPRDTIFSGFGMGGTSYLYENGRFRAIITSD